MTSQRVAILRRTAHIALDRPRLTAWTLVTATIAFAIGGAALLAGTVAARWSASHDAGSGSMVIYLDDGVAEPAGHQLAAKLTAMPGVVQATLVPASESAKRLSEALSADTALLEGIDLTSLPASIEVTLAPGTRDVIAISPAVQALRETPGVGDIVVEPDDSVADETATQRLGGLVGRSAIVVAALTLLIAFAAMRVWLEGDRAAYRVFDLLGASPGFARGPTVLAGAVLGGAAATCAALLLAGGIAWSAAAMTSLLGSAAHSGLPSGLMILRCIAIGSAAGAVAGWLAGDSRGMR